MDWTDRRRRFRALLAGDRCVHPGSVFDPISARIAEDLGFEVGMFAGSTASLTVLGAPDLIVLTLSEFAGQAYRINRAGNLPLLVDADHGYGNALNAKRTVEELETAGVCCLSLEDTDLPTPFGSGQAAAHLDRRRRRQDEGGAGRPPGSGAVHRRPHQRGRDRRARRCDRAWQGLRGRPASTRCSSSACGRAPSSTRSRPRPALPLILGGVSGELADLDYLGARRVRVALQGHQPFAAAVKAVHDTLKALREGTPPGKLAGVADAELMKRVTRDADYAAGRRSSSAASPSAPGSRRRRRNAICRPG